MVTFKRKSFAGTQTLGQMIKEGAVKGVSNPFAWLGAVGTTVSIANYRTNKQNKEQSARQHAEVSKQNERLINALSGVEQGLKTTKIKSIQIPVEQPQPDRAWIRVRGRRLFSQKKKKIFSFREDIFNGAALGATTGTAIASGYMLKPEIKKETKVVVPLVGAALGALVGGSWAALKWLDQRTSRFNSGHSLIKEVRRMLSKAGYREGTDWTGDPKKATLLKTKVCFVISRSADELGLLINTVSDPKLGQVTKTVLSKLPAGSRKTEKVSDRFNEVTITSFPGSDDAVYIFGVIEKFLKAGFPVHIMEVG